MMDLLRRPTRLPLVAPSILSADFAELGAECEDVLGSGADLLHLDVMDGHFVPNLTMGPALCASLRRRFPEVFLDVHLMVTDPTGFVERFVEAGASLLTFHVEAVGGAGAVQLAERVRGLGVGVGIAISPPTPAEEVLPIVGAFDLVLVMSVNPGYSGQRFMPEVLDKTRSLRRRLRPDQRLEMDGGLDPSTVAGAVEAGCDVVVSASALFGVSRGERSATIAALRGGGCA